MVLLSTSFTGLGTGGGGGWGVIVGADICSMEMFKML